MHIEKTLCPSVHPSAWFMSETTRSISIKFGLEACNKSRRTNLISVYTTHLKFLPYMKPKVNLINVLKTARRKKKKKNAVGGKNINLTKIYSFYLKYFLRCNEM